jgi:hypothetical protein
VFRDPRFVIGVATTPHDNTRLFFIGAAALIFAAAVWLAIEVRRAWNSAPPPGVDRNRDSRPPAVESHPLVPQLVEEIIRLNATIAQLRDEANHPVAASSEADLANWALAGLEARLAEREGDTYVPHAHGVAAQRGQPSS